MCGAAQARAASPRGRGDCPEIKGLVGRAAPGTRRGQSDSNSNSGHSVGWRGTVGLRGRRKSVHGGLVAASMPLTPRKPTVPRLRQIVATCSRSTPCVDEISQISKSPKSRLTGRRKLSKAGWVRLRGRERHGWRDRASMDGFTAAPATGPTPPTRRKPAFDVASAVASASAGAGRSPAELQSRSC